MFLTQSEKTLFSQMSFYSRDIASDFPYELGEKVPGQDDKSIWKVHKGKQKDSGDSVSIFAYDVKNSSDPEMNQVAKNSLRRLKTLQHPNILTFLDGVETDEVIYYATEPVTPLETFLKDNANDIEKHSEEALSWGIYQIGKASSFLINDCNLIHNNICMASIFVDLSGNWKLAGVDFMCAVEVCCRGIPPVKHLRSLDVYEPPEKYYGRVLTCDKWSSDAWGLGCFIWEVFNGNLTREASIHLAGKIPQNLIPNYFELVHASPSKTRLNPAQFLENCRKRGGFMNNSFVDSKLSQEENQRNKGETE